MDMVVEIVSWPANTNVRILLVGKNTIGETDEDWLLTDQWQIVGTRRPWSSFACCLSACP